MVKIAGKNFDQNLRVLQGVDQYHSNKVKAGMMGKPTRTDKKRGNDRVQGRSLILYRVKEPTKVLATCFLHPEWGPVEAVIDQPVERYWTIKCKHGKMEYTSAHQLAREWSISFKGNMI